MKKDIPKDKLIIKLKNNKELIENIFMQFKINIKLFCMKVNL